MTGLSRPKESTLIEIQPMSMKFDEEYVSFPPTLWNEYEWLVRLVAFRQGGRIMYTQKGSHTISRSSAEGPT